MLPGSISRSILFVISFAPINSTTLSEFHNQFQFHVHPAPAGLILLLSFSFSYISHMCMYRHSALRPHVWKAKIYDLFPAIGGWSFATGDNRESFCLLVAIEALNKSNVITESYPRHIYFLRYRLVSTGCRRLILHSSTCARERDIG